MNKCVSKGKTQLRDQETSKGKVELNIGAIRFSGEGDQTWLAEQIAIVIDASKSGQLADPTLDEAADDDLGQGATVTLGSLASYLKAKGGDTVQVQRFLSTAAWLHHRGEKPLTSSLVTKTLREHQQKRLSNTADCLNQNVGRGFCEKTPDGFFITPEGWKHLGEER